MFNADMVFLGARDAVLEAGHFIRNHVSQVTDDRITDKGLNQLVSYVDREAELLLVNRLSHVIPESGFITEEATTVQQQKAYTWIIDPLDGTTNFLHALPAFSVSVALMRNETLIMGLVYDIMADRLYHAVENEQAQCNGQYIHVSKVGSLDKSLLATGFPYYDFEKMGAYLLALQEFMRTTQGLRRFGSAALDLAYTAEGRFDGFFEWGLSPWDVAAGAFIVQQAGGKVGTFDGGTDYLFGKTIVAANDAVYLALKDRLTAHFK